MIAGLPRKEVQGLKVREEVPFGLNVPDSTGKDSIRLGLLMKDGGETKTPVTIDRNALDKHTFVAGVTGSGKTTTCQTLLKRSGFPYWVIEPAKTEYRSMDDTLVFSLGTETAGPFRFNPFELLKGESISSHVDMFRASLEAAFSMEAAIPQLLESALYSCYKKRGWDIDSSTNREYDDPWAEDASAFPTISELLNQIESEVENAGLKDRLGDEYIGSIRARLQSLVLGAKGSMLNCSKSVDFTELLDKNVVLELESIRSVGQKSFLMGMILSRYQEAVRLEYQKTGKAAKRILLVEEAHRLLSKYQPGDSPTKTQGVEIFTDMLAEIRKYGVCLVIADQIPNKLADDVLKNTNTKIVHRIFAQDDKDAIGNTMALSEDQKRYLSSLRVGRAIIYAEGYDQAVQTMIEQEGDTSNNNVDDTTLRNRVMDEYYYKTSKVRGGFLPLRIPYKSLSGEEQEYCSPARLTMLVQEYQKACGAGSEAKNEFPEKRKKELLILQGMLRKGGVNRRQLEGWMTGQLGISKSYKNDFLEFVDPPQQSHD